MNRFNHFGEEQMSNLGGESETLRPNLPDQTGMMPHSRLWLDYLLARYGRLANGEEAGEPGSIPLAAWRVIPAHVNSCD